MKNNVSIWLWFLNFFGLLLLIWIVWLGATPSIVALLTAISTIYIILLSIIIYTFIRLIFIDLSFSHHCWPSAFFWVNVAS